jgi:putative salt-induced outer membrane protein YdiY
MNNFSLLVFTIFCLFGCQFLLAQITSIAGQNVNELVKKHDDIFRVWRHTEDHGWRSSVDLALNTSQGNSDSGFYTAGVRLEKKRGQNNYFARVLYTYGEKDETATLDELLGLLSWKRLGSGGYYTGIRVDYRSDKLAGIDYRLGVTVLQGYMLLEGEKGWLAPEVGVGFAGQDIGGKDQSRLNSYFGIHSEYWFAERTRFYSSITTFFPFEDVRSHYLWGEIGVETLLTDGLSLKLYVQDAFENTPAKGREKNDFRINAGLSIKL